MPPISDSDSIENERDNQQWLQLARRGDFDGAWQVSDRVLQRHVRQPNTNRPRHEQSIWMGGPLDNARVLVRCYHGLGDTIQFIRYAPALHAIAREVIVWAQPSLLRLLESVEGIDRLVPLTDGAPDVEYDLDLEVMELPFIFRSTLATLPNNVPYVAAAPALLPGVRPRVGLIWRCGDWELRRSVPFDTLRPLLDLAGITWCSLQQHRHPEESHPNLVDVSAEDIYEAARHMAALDLVITVDSMPAHLAGALGVPVWTLLLKEADWRWMEDREDSPWYPTMRLFRQQRDGDWAGVVERLVDQLRTSGASPLRPSP